MNATVIEKNFSRILKNIEDLGYAFMIELRHYKRPLVASAILDKLRQLRHDITTPDNRLELLLEEYKTISNDIDKVLNYYKNIERMLDVDTAIYEDLYEKFFKEKE